MGWLFCHRPEGQSIKSFIKNNFEFERDQSGLEVLDIAIVDITTAYLAIRYSNDAQCKSFVYAAVLLLRYFPNKHNNTGYKSIDESALPFYFSCPERILNLLTPLDLPDGPHSELGREHAKEWRDACWENVRRRKDRRGMLRRGMRLKHPTGVKFSNGEVLDEFLVLDPRSTVFGGPKGFGRYRLSRRFVQECQLIA